MLLAQKSYVEGALALDLYCARLVDDIGLARADQAAAPRRQLLGVLTPIAKSWPSQWCLAANDLAIQVLGGAGYTRDHDVEQHYRDNRLNPIHEGTHGIQAQDLLGRKVLRRRRRRPRPAPGPDHARPPRGPPRSTPTARRTPRPWAAPSTGWSR